MPDAKYRPPLGYLTMAEAQMRLGISRATLQRMARRGQLTLYRDPRNRRVRLLRIEDVDRLTQPIPEQSEESNPNAKQE